MVSVMDRSVSILTVLVVLATAGAGRAEDLEARAEFLQKALQSVPADCGERTLAPYFFVRSEGDEGTERLPLKAVDAEVNIAGACFSFPRIWKIRLDRLGRPVRISAHDGITFESLVVGLGVVQRVVQPATLLA